MSGNAWVTLATNDSYALGTLVLASSLRAVGTTHQLAVMVTRGVSPEMKEQLRSAFDLLFEVNILDSQDEVNLSLLSRPELGLTFTKLHCWRLTQFQKCVFMDADTMVVRNCDELFDREELSAAPDAGWPDCFNSGVFVYRPSLETFRALLSFAVTHGSFDGGDQGLLNSFFADWATKDIAFHLPFIYNMCSNAVYSYLPAYKNYGDSVKIVHFIGPNKPWLMHFDVETGCVHPPAGFHHVLPLLQKWWDIFFASVHSRLSSTMAGLAGAFAQLRLGAPRSDAQTALEEHLRRQNWEQGQADYMGSDSFDNIWNKICTTLSAAPGKQSRIKSTDEQATENKTEAVVEGEEPKVETTVAKSTEASVSPTAASDSPIVSLQEKQSSKKI
ncbi:glycogenin-1 isoform X4 [Bacillus rossius redtenbacheri]|uniref:glycogenin-1 isoform X4 n=1 Tax=Bacillus rossius redtenbacheri TaxID=93214 RepID=UPI002FDCBF8B